jgi:type 1 glutamine amidotransferase
MTSRLVGIAVLLASAGGAVVTTAAVPRKIVLIAGAVGSHGPGEHEYLKAMRLFQHSLTSSPNLGPVNVEVHADGWPEDPATLDDADAIVFYSDGADHEGVVAPFLTAERLALLETQVARGCGIAALHYSTILPRREAGRWLRWFGGYFDFETGPPPKHWHSRIRFATSAPWLATPQHPISNGVRPFEVREEYYYNLRLADAGSGFVPIWETPIPGEARPQTVAWAIQREDGGRGFGTSCGHSYANLLVPDFRKLHLNAIAWIAGIAVPAGGVESTLPAEADWLPAGKPATWDDAWAKQDPTQAVRALLLTGDDHPAHVWQETSPALRSALWRDARFRVDTSHDPEALADLDGYDVVVLSYCNWESPGLSEAAKQGLVGFLESGGGVVLIHFANGAWHYSLPGAEDSDWPEYRRICRRVWDHTADSAHDPYGTFQVDIVDTEHPITRGLPRFETIDELYYRQAGELPIHVLASAHSKQIDEDTPIAWVSEYGEGRVFQTLLGHSADSISNPNVEELIRRGCLWVTRRLE